MFTPNRATLWFWGNIFSYQGKQYQLPLEKVCYPGKVELRLLPDNSLRVFNKDQELIAELEG